MIGEVYSNLVVVAEAESRVSSGQRKKYALVRCECGSEKEVRYTHLLQGRTLGCGCKKPGKSKHYMTKSRLHNIWCGMRQRCRDVNHKSYSTYGAVGVHVCEEWGEFNKFHEWSMSNGYEPHLTIDRVNNSKTYSPDTCEWITLQENIRRRDVCKNGGSI